MDSVTVKRIHNSDNKLANEKIVDEWLDGGNVLSFYLTLENYFEVYVGDIVYNLTKYDELQITYNKY